MLAQLVITDFAIIESLSVSFSEGFNIISGETGAGKSIIVNAVNLILGGRASTELVRSGAETASVEALFQLPLKSPISRFLEDMDIPFNGELLIKRTISNSGKSRVWINGSMATLQIVSLLGPHLISVSGQNEHQLLLKPNNHIFILDDFGELTQQRLKFSEVYSSCYSLKEKYERLRSQLIEEETRRELTEFQLNEIKEAGLVPGEDNSLDTEKSRLIHAEKLVEIIYKSYQALYEKDESVLSVLSLLEKDMEKGLNMDPHLDNYRKQSESARLQLEDLALELRDFYSNIKIDPQRLEEVEERLQLIRRLKKKYGSTIEEIISFKEELAKKGDMLSRKKEELEELEVRIEEGKKDLMILAAELSKKRREIAEEFEKSVEEELHLLNMAGTRFKVQFSRPESRSNIASKDIFDFAVTADGMDVVEFFISPNVGEEMRPLAKIASGGELSRITLALKTILARSGLVETLVFDEIDAGIGGATAAVVGEKLRSLANYQQVLGITHLPQIAACGERHFLVEKGVRKGRTQTFINLLDKEHRVAEIARLLAGKKISEKTLAHAREMLSC
ncbi:MAG TPA: DNA repair protein RecN [Desulfatiglandales bacterium]|nr:DNA repair protein RecN [Desulfatiglandales bacterium]